MEKEAEAAAGNPIPFDFLALRFGRSYIRKKEEANLRPFKIPRKRQGRSWKVRERKRRERERAERIRNHSGCRVEASTVPGACKVCGRNDGYVNDYGIGETICSFCGCVMFGVEFMDSPMDPRPPMSKPYQREVHFRQRFALLQNKDPRIDADDELGTSLWDWVLENKEKLTSELGLPEQRYWGYNSFKKLLAHPNLPFRARMRASRMTPSKVALHWIQLRALEMVEPTPPQIGRDQLDRLCDRFACVSRAFDALFQPEQEKGKGTLPRKRNITNLNYVIAQVLWLESPELYRAYAKFLPQSTSAEQPAKNNEEWKLIVQFCNKHFGLGRMVELGIQEERLRPVGYMLKQRVAFFDEWQLHLITEEDIVKYFKFFD